MKLINICFLLVGLVSNDYCSAQNYHKTSPCPNVFNYETELDTSDTWHGTLRLQTAVPLHGITVDVILDRKAATFGAYYFKDVSTNDYMEYRVEDKNYRLDPGKTLEMNIYVRYERRQQTPNLRQVRLNGQNICVELPNAAVQPIYPSNSQQNSGTMRTFQGDSPDAYNFNNNFNSNNNYDSTTLISSYENSWNQPTTTIRSTTSDRRRDLYGNEFYNTSRTTTIRPNSNTNYNGQGYDIYNQQQPRETSTSRNFAFASGNGNSFNHQNNQDNQNSQSGKGYEVYNNNNNQRTTSTTKSPNFYEYSGNQNNNQNSHRTSTTRSTTTTRDTFIFDRRPTPSTKRPSYFQGDLPISNNYDTSTHSILNVEDKTQCGVVIPKATPLIANGEDSYHGQFPWHAAIYLSDIGSLKYICGGSLVSMSAVVTAAHCVTLSKSKRLVSTEKLLAYLGKQNLQKWTGNEQDAKISEIIVNNEYNPESFFSDIAILKLKDTLTRSNYVRPVCIWTFDNDLRVIVNKHGLVPGWGYNEEGVVSDELAYLKMPVVTHETCIWSNRDFFSKVTSDKSFCAGFRNGTSVCGGDSGGGMVFKQGNKYYLRGVVSISVALQNSRKCDGEHYIVFADAAKYTNWINRNI